MKYLLIILLLASCTKEVSKPFPVSAPESRPVPVTITVRLWKAQQSWGEGWLIRITMPEKVKDTVRVTTYWKDAATTYSPTVTIFPNGQEVTAAIWWEAKGEYRDLKLPNVEGEKNVFYTLKVVQ